jgi:predicted phage gp36 major capsid-like protein
MVIVDRISSTLDLVPHLFGSNRRPMGQRGALLWFRTGSDMVIPNAFRLLSIPTTA